MGERLSDAALDQLFLGARSRNGWNPEPLPESLIHEVYSLARLGPTAANSNPARFVFCMSTAARERLAKISSGSNRAKIMEAPCTVIIAYDLDFPELMHRLFPPAPDIGAGLRNSPTLETMALRNSSLQGAYLMLAARSLGLDCGPMSGFDNDKVDAEFFAGTRIKSNFICSMGYGTEKGLFERLPQLDFEEACQIL